MTTRIIPNNFRDYLAIISFLGFLAIFLKFSLNQTFLEESMTPIFLCLGGIGLMFVGKVFSITKWAKNGIQRNEISMLFTSIFGIASFIIGILIWVGINLPLEIKGWIGLLSLAPAIFILIDYLSGGC